MDIYKTRALLSIFYSGLVSCLKEGTILILSALSSSMSATGGLVSEIFMGDRLRVEVTRALETGVLGTAMEETIELATELVLLLAR